MSNSSIPDPNNDAEQLLLLDAEGLLFEMIAVDDEVSVAAVVDQLYARDPSARALRELYYLEARSAAIVVGQPDDAIHEMMRKWCRSALLTAAKLTHRHLQDGVAVEPRWLGEYSEPLIHALQSEHPIVTDVAFQISMEPRFSARALASNRINLSAATRMFLRHNNMAMWSLVDVAMLEGIVEHIPLEVSTAARMLLPQIVYGHDDIPASRLPYAGTHKRSLAMLALATTRLQMLFLIAHELGHLVMGHLGYSGLREDERLALELEADTFAVHALRTIAATEPQTSDGDIWTAVRWLFQFQMLDDVVGRLLRDQPLDNEGMYYRLRNNNLYKGLSALRVDRNDNLLEMHGTILLATLRRTLAELGMVFMREVADELHLPTPGLHAAWWEGVPDSAVSVRGNAINVTNAQAT